MDHGGRDARGPSKNMKPASNTPSRLLDQLDELRSRFDPRGSLRLEQILSRIGRAKINDAESTIRFHELLLFICAYPQSAGGRRLAESLLRSFHKRVEALRDAEVNLDSLEHPEVSGIAGTS